ncbi:MAG TPA: NAD(P)-dependent alcohol dehydrogenase [Flavobacteriales bacterium]|nr:NAD(P)-dependent alcohol dehydrogenase [Flavobacteriales bacterium]HMR27682.1 NAD(P)-dependent alcohol dehydrogenase [Flavobacteriales bacterium]
MQAALATAYGGPDVIRIAEVPTPSPKKNEVLIRIHASAVNAADWRLRRADPWFVRLVFGPFKPRRAILGVVFAGEVVQAGADVTKYKKGDRLFGWTSIMGLGGHAEYIALKENGAFARMPDALSYTDAAAIPFGFGTARHFLHKAKVDKGLRVLIYGASGAVGSAAVQLAHVMGAEVTGVCSTRNVELVRSLGATEVLDYTKDDLSAQRDHFDVVFETVGKLPFKDSLTLVKPQGTIITGSEMPAQMLTRAFAGKSGKQVTVISGTAVESAADMQLLADLWQRQEIRPVIDSTFPLARIQEAHALAESGRKVGNVVITLR